MIDSGVLTAEAVAVRSLDLTGDGKQDPVIDGKELGCSRSRTMFCGGTNLWRCAKVLVWSEGAFRASGEH
ncbi:hypothetical protein [Nisaea sp.]|uniref:hypothetical protein n=1 Tax=Nisaea sp. TaxID=2024842 RepID=UPI0032968834